MHAYSIDKFKKNNDILKLLKKDPLGINGKNTETKYANAPSWTEFLVNIIILSFLNINTKNKRTRTMLEIRRISRLSSLSFIKLLLINVKNVRKPKEIVNINITMINKFLFNKANII